MANQPQAESAPKTTEGQSDPNIRERVKTLTEKVSRLNETLGKVEETLREEP